MFAKSIIDSDTFLDMPLSTQALYFHLSMRADDDGFVNNPRKIMRMIGADDDSLKLLTAKQFLIPFESGIVVIKHWRIHNYIRKDRYQATVYTEEQAQLILDDSLVYHMSDNLSTNGQPSDTPTVYQRSTTGIPSDIPTVDAGKDRLGKDRLGKDRLGKDREDEFSTNLSTFSCGCVYLTPEQYNALTQKYPKHIVDDYIRRVSDYCQSKNRNYSDYVMTISRWIDEDVAKGKVTLTEPSHDVDEWTKLAMATDPSIFLDKK